MDDEEKVIAASAAVIMYCCAQLSENRKKEKRKRRWWMVSLNKSRDRYSGSNMLADLRQEPSERFENFCRMSSTDFEFLLNLIGPKITKNDTRWRKAIPVQERLAIALRFLASGDTFRSLGFLFKVSHQAISGIVSEVCTALNEALHNEIELPHTPDVWEKVANGFEQLWNFPHCLGALDGKHIILQAPFNSESEFFNYKKTFSLVLMALVDSDYCFTFVDIGAQGRMNDAGVYKTTSLYRKLKMHQLNLPPRRTLPGRNFPVPYVIIGDDAFPMSDTLLKPYSGIHKKGSLERVYNYRICRARRIVENAFGILSSIFRVFRSSIRLQPQAAATITFTCTVLHNFLRKSKTSRNSYSPPGIFDREEGGNVTKGTWREDSVMSSFTPLQIVPRKSSVEAKEIRKEFAHYFLENGSVPWQEDYC